MALVPIVGKISRNVRKEPYTLQDEGVTANDETGQTKGGNEEVKVNGSTKLEDKTSTEPGSLAERPMGNAPPPKNEDLADDVAPTFEVSLSSHLLFSHPSLIYHNDRNISHLN